MGVNLFKNGYHIKLWNYNPFNGYLTSMIIHLMGTFTSNGLPSSPLKNIKGTNWARFWTPKPKFTCEHDFLDQHFHVMVRHHHCVALNPTFIWVNYSKIDVYYYIYIYVYCNSIYICMYMYMYIYIYINRYRYRYIPTG